MNNLLDNEQVSEVQDVVEVVFETLQTISRNHEAYAGVIADAACRGVPALLYDMGKELEKVEPNLSYAIFDAAHKVRTIINQGDEQHVY